VLRAFDRKFTHAARADERHDGSDFLSPLRVVRASRLDDQHDDSRVGT
jgi:hypothetical protein